MKTDREGKKATNQNFYQNYILQTQDTIGTPPKKAPSSKAASKGQKKHIRIPLGMKPNNTWNTASKHTKRTRKKQLKEAESNKFRTHREMDEITRIEEMSGTQPENIRRKLLRKQLQKAKGNNFRTPMGMKTYKSKTQLEHRLREQLRRKQLAKKNSQRRDKNHHIRIPMPF